MCVCACARPHARPPGWKGWGEGRGRRSHRVRIDKVLTALGGGSAQKAGRQLPSRAHSVTAFTNKNSNNTHRHQSGQSHSALDSEPPLLGAERDTGSGRMRYLCGPRGAG